MTKTSLGLEENFEAMLCYVFFWVSGLFFYFVEDKNKFIRFHAMQSILVFLPLMILAWIFGGFFGVIDYGPALVVLSWISWIFWLMVLVMWLVLMVKAFQMQRYKLPIIGDIAEKNS
ncbi:MAG: hypothetical protein BV459_04095 [Thermoplasmata archaeon M11B2D]|nr:MAG: hypothetical protein BV459_04095 [Thermoplasmata archaeon M11B2D]